MSGHNRWSKVKRIKGPIDAKRGKVFTKLIKEITVAARLGGGNPDGNPRLRAAIVSSKAVSMPKENIDRAIKKGTGELEDGSSIDELVYEGYGPGGVAVIVEATTDNKNRTVNDLRVLFKKAGGSLAEQGAVAFMFDKCGQLVFDRAKHSSDTLMEIALEAGAKDVAEHPDNVEVLTEVPDLYKVKETFDRLGIHPETTGYSFVPKSMVPVEKEKTEGLLALLDEIEEHDDIQRVHSNAELDEAVIAELNAKQ